MPAAEDPASFAPHHWDERLAARGRSRSKQFCPTFASTEIYRERFESSRTPTITGRQIDGAPLDASPLANRQGKQELALVPNP